MYIYGTNSYHYQLFKYRENGFLNQNKKWLDVHGGKDDEGVYVIANAKKEVPSQKWEIRYLDKMGN